MFGDDVLAPPNPGWIGSWLARMLDEAKDIAVVLIDADGRIAAWLNGAERLFGFSREETIGQPVGLLFTPEDRATGMHEHELATAAAVGYSQDDRWHVRKDGSMLWGSGTVVAIRNRQGRLLGFGKIVRDRTDLRTQTETLKNRLNAQVEARHRDELVMATLAHELRNPLGSLAMATRVLAIAGADSEPMRQPLKIIERQLLMLRRLVDDLMDVSQLRTGKLRLALERACLQHELRWALSVVDGDASAKGVELGNVLPEIDIHIELDRDRFHQIAVNLLTNAIKFTPAGGRVWTDNGHAVVRIEDSGCGIAPDLQPRLFTLFTQGGNVPEGRRGGLGIGLALVKELVSLHSGTIAVRSEGVGKGSEFMLRFPLVQRGAATVSDGI